MRYFFAAIALAATIVGAHAQTVTATFPAPGGSNANTMACQWIDSTLQVGGVPIGQMQACYGLPDATAMAMVGAYVAQCPPTFAAPVPGQPPAAPTPCTVAQALVYLAGTLQSQVMGTAQGYLQQQAARAAPQVTVTPMQ